MSGTRAIAGRRSVLGWLGAGLGMGLAGALLPWRTSAQGLPSIGFEAGRLVQGGWGRGRTVPGATLTLDGQPVRCADDGRFFLAFDRDCPSGAVLAVRLASGITLSQALAIAPRDWRIEQVDAPFHPPELPDVRFLAIRKLERARIDAARALDTGAQGWRQAFAWPASGRISGHFGAQRIYRGTPGSYHGGVDIAGGAGGEIRAPADGVVVLAAAAPFTLEGRLLMIDHGMGLSSAFLHCSEHRVAEGDAVRQGQVLGLIGMTGRATGPHLHWGLRWGEARLDPELFVDTPMPA